MGRRRLGYESGAGADLPWLAVLFKLAVSTRWWGYVGG
jgi:hypothetical protein